MIINNVPVNADVIDILSLLRSQLAEQSISLFQVIRDTPDNVMVSCPYHKGGQERRPSAGIKKSDGLFHCFACGEVHSLSEVISHCFGYDDFGQYGWSWILQNFVTVQIEVRKDITLNLSRSSVATLSNYISEEELDKYRVYHPYMWKRKMTPEIVEIFDIGYDEFTECITFPVRDINGNTLFIARRSVKTKFFNYPEKAKKPVYGIYELAHSAIHGPVDEVIICESMIDCITCWVYGKYAVALNGLGDDYQMRQLNALPYRKYVLATDNDERGLLARKYLRTKLPRKLISEYELPSGKKDINDLTKEEFIQLKEFF